MSWTGAAAPRSAEEINGARPHSMSIVLLHAHVEAGIALSAHRDPTSESKARLANGIWELLQVDDAAEPAGLERTRLKPQPGDERFAGHQRCLEGNPPRLQLLQPEVDAAEIASRDCLPGNACAVLSLDTSVEIPIVDHARAHDAIALDLQRPIPGRGTRAASILCPFIAEAHAVAEIGRSIGPHRVD